MRNAKGIGCWVLVLGLAACSSGGDDTASDDAAGADDGTVREDAAPDAADEAGPADEATADDAVDAEVGEDDAALDEGSADEATGEDAPGEEGEASTAPGETCATAIVLHDGDVLTGQTTVGMADDIDVGATGGCAAGRGPDLVYAATIPNMSTLTITVTPEAAYDASVNLIEGPASACTVTPLSCAGNANSSGPGVVETLVSINFSGMTRNVFVVVDGPTATDAGSYTLTAAIR